jgi:phage terminase large subunit
LSDQSQSQSTLNATFPEKLEFLFHPARYKIAYGGRGSGKSWGVARALLIQGYEKPLRILCARELQNSITDSVHKLLSDQIEEMGLGEFYEIQNTSIRGQNGTEFAFRGLRHNVTAIKSFESVDIAWVEEAQTVSKSSWETLDPTIRKDGAEIWITFNPELDTDETYKRFVTNPPPGAVVQRVNWSDNPFFPHNLREKMEHLRVTDPDSWLTVYEGHCRQTLDGAIYAREIRRATEEGRLTRVPYDATKPVHTFWDLGWADNTSIWFAQAVGFEYHVIDYLEGSQQPLTHYLQELQKRGYVYGTDWLPHDGQSKQLGTGRSIEEMMRAAGRTVRIVPKLSVADGINAARTVFAQCWFDSERCADGLQCLRRYRYDVDQDTGQFSKVPLHDQASHGADAFRYLALGLKDGGKPKVTKIVPTFRPGPQSWMGR